MNYSQEIIRINTEVIVMFLLAACDLRNVELITGLLVPLLNEDTNRNFENTTLFSIFSYFPKTNISLRLKCMHLDIEFVVKGIVLFDKQTVVIALPLKDRQMTDNVEFDGIEFETFFSKIGEEHRAQNIRSNRLALRQSFVSIQ